MSSHHATILVCDDDRLVLITLASALKNAGYDVIEADNGEVTLDVDAASYTNALEAVQHSVMWVRGTNETYSIVTNNIDNTTYVDLPISTTNHLLLERRPGWPRFQIWQDFR